MVICSIAASVSGQADRASPPKWFRGNTHTHTLNSDGDSQPADVVRWYRENGYNFVFITDHEFITSVAPLNDLLGLAGSFAVFSGQEVTDSFDKKPYHVNGLGLERVVLPWKSGPGSTATLQRDLDAIRAAGGIPQLNHPNFGWAVTEADISKLSGIMLFELYNGHPLVNNLGGGDSPGVETIWDAVLASGKLIYGVASDDAHNFKQPFDRSVAAPGRGWIYVRAPDLSARAILDAMERGDFYASTGVELEEYSADHSQVTLKVKAERWSKYRIQFIGSGGRILSETGAGQAVYRFTGNEGYVRAKVIESNGKTAWTQPVLVKKK
ncbi:MAG: CehA/McbA family metallohydrolase [Pyrinomonadaceae bacterium]